MSLFQKRHGIPYQGSKNGIDRNIVDALPSSRVLVEPFMGGGAVTHCALLSGKFKKIVSSDIKRTPALFYDAATGKVDLDRYEYTRWISREEFFAKKDENPYIYICYSFSSGGREYCYGVYFEPFKKAVHNAVVFGDMTGLREIGIHCPPSVYKCRKYKDRAVALSKFFRENERAVKGTYLNWYKKHYDCNELHESKILNMCYPHKCCEIERMIRIVQLRCLKSLVLEKLTCISEMPYDKLEIPEDAVVYCDPPYAGTSGYNVSFDNDKFWNWVREKSKTNIVCVSEYNAPEDFVCVLKIAKQIQMQQGGGNGYAFEKLFVHKSKVDEYKQRLEEDKKINL